MHTFLLRTYEHICVHILQYHPVTKRLIVLESHSISQLHLVIVVSIMECPMIWMDDVSVVQGQVRNISLVKIFVGDAIHENLSHENLSHENIFTHRNLNRNVTRVSA